MYENDIINNGCVIQLCFMFIPLHFNVKLEEQINW